MTVSINQPAYLPWLGYFDRIYKSDIYVVLDSVQFEKNSVTNRNKIRTKDGWAWLTVPLHTKGKFGDLSINKIEIFNQTNWQKKHWEQIKQNYSKAPYFKDHRSFFESLYSKQWETLQQINTHILDYLINELGIKTKIMYASLLNIEGTKAELVLNICKHLNATSYLSGPFGRDYLDEKIFGQSNIKIQYHDYNHPQYQQNFPNFEPYMSTIDLLFNYGKKSIDILSNS